MKDKLQYKPTDFRSGEEVKWCPGCGNYAILTSFARALPEVANEKEIEHKDFALISGIGCSSRFPYYVNIYGLHGIHGRALPIATGAKVANPKLSTWVTVGDGDSMAIGGNHFIHAIRRNIDLNIMLFNNQIYGLTKGQYSPTSKLGKVTPTSPFGTVEQPFVPGELVLGSQGTFFARSIDMEVELTKECCVEASRHDGTAVVEVLQNCVIYNDGVFAAFAGSPEARIEHTITLKHGEKMLFGADKKRGLILDCRGMGLKVVEVGKNGVTEEHILTHDMHRRNPFIHMMLANMEYPEFPVALGVIRSVKDETYDESLVEQIDDAQQKRTITNIDQLIRSGKTWKVFPE